MSESALRDACNFVWATERQMVPVLEKCRELAGTHDCLEEVDEVLSIHKHVLHDCTELMAVLRIESAGTLVELTVPTDFATCIITIHGHFTRAIDHGYIVIDPHAQDPAQRAVLERVTRRKADQMRILIKIAVKCQIELPSEMGPPGRPPHGRPPHERPPHERPPHERPPHERPPHERPPERPPVGGTQYVVQPGDTMYGIAKRFGVPLDVLIRANPQVRNPDLIVVGEIIHIPGGRPPAPPHGPGHGPSPGRRYVVKPGDTMFLIAQRFTVSLSELIAFNPQIPDPNFLVPGQVVLIPTASGALG